MKELFRIETDLFSVNWDRTAKRDPPILAQRTAVHGRLILKKRLPNLQFLEGTWRADVPKHLELDPSLEIGPPLYEQTDYQVYLKSRNPDDTISLHHRDPNITQGLSSREGGQVLHGTINFKNQIGLSCFTVSINGKPILDFELEAFPTKIDYETDYKQILAQIQEILTSLAYEYLRSTHQLGKLDKSRKPSRSEWLILLEHIVDGLEKAVRYIAHQPRRSITRQSQSKRIEKVRRVESSIRSQVRRGAGKGQVIKAKFGPGREQLVVSDSIPTLDTMEHRWIKRQLIEIRRTLSQLFKSETDIDTVNERGKAIQETLRRLESRISQLLKLEPLLEANVTVPNNFASLQLVSAPGYKEVYASCMNLKFGLRLEGDVYRMTVKDLNLLYEYWVFLAIVNLLRESSIDRIKLRDIFKLNQKSLQVRLTEGRKQQVDFVYSDRRKVSVVYNCQFSAKETTLIPQKPDVTIRFQESGWPEVLLLCDAKYRFDASPEYRQQFGSFGPPPDAINVLHRYRDAILEEIGQTDSANRLKHVVVQAVAAFPFAETEPQEFAQSRLWRSIETIGIGAVPVLPTNLVYLREWLVKALQNGGWAMADRAIPHVAESRLRDLRIAESESVLVGTLRPRNPQEHFDWIQSTNIYYVPLSKNQLRQLDAKQIAIYVPHTMAKRSAITHIADVREISLVKRGEIVTPWSSRLGNDKTMVLYRLSDFRELSNPIKYHHADPTSIQSPRYSTCLGLERARLLSEIALETELEWRLYDMLTVAQISFRIEATPPKQINPNNRIGRARFRISDHFWIRYDGMNGFLIHDQGSKTFMTGLNDVIEFVRGRA